MQMESNKESVQDGHSIALSLISQFCDSKLKEMSNKCIPEKLTKEQRNYLYSDVLAIASGSSSSSIENGYETQSSTSTNTATPENLELSIKREINLSKHIKPFDFANLERMSEDPPVVNLVEDENEKVCDRNEQLNCATHLTLLARERLESYLPVLKQRIKNEKWSSLKTVSSLETIINKDELPVNENSLSVEFLINPTCHKCSWDTDQGFLFSSTDEPMVFYGMLEKPSAIKPQRLKKLFDCIGVASLPLQSMVLTPKQLYFVDGTAKIKLNDISGKLKFSQIVTGVVVAIIGRVRGITLQAEDVIFATPHPPEWPMSKKDNIEMVYVSGLHLGNEEGSNLSLDLLQDYLLGLSGSVYEQSNVLFPRVRLFLLGNMIGKCVSRHNVSWEEETAYVQRAMEKLDDFLEPLLRVMEVFLIPGENDPSSTSTFPNPPIHPKMLPQAQAFPTLKRLTNPVRVHVSVSKSDSTCEESQDMDVTSPSSTAPSEYSLLDSSYADFLKEDIDFIDILFQSGRNLRQTMDYCDMSCPIEMGIQLLKWGHLHPTYCDINSVLAQNIFRLKGSLPHVVAIGNLSEFRCATWNGTKVIGIPAFHKSHTAVTFTKDFNVLPISFKLM